MRALRIACFALLTLLATASLVVTVATADWPPGELGWNVGADGTTVTFVEPGGPVDRAGVHAGDRTVYGRLPLAVRINTVWNIAIGNGQSMQFDVRRGASTLHVRATAAAMHRFEWYAHTLNRVAAALYVLLGIGLMYLRPNRMTLAFFLTGVLGFVPWYALIWAQRSEGAFAVAYGADAVLSGLVVFGWLWFVSRFPHDALRRRLRLLPSVGAAFGAATIALGWTIVARIAAPGAPPPAWILFAFSYAVPVLLAASVLAALAVAYASTSGTERQRVTPLLIAFSFFVFAYAVNVVTNLYITGDIVNLVVVALNAVASLLVAGAVAHGIIYNRAMDITFILSRTVAYAIIAAIVVCVFVIISDFAGKIVNMAGLADVASIVAALTIGLFLNAAQKWMTNFVDRVLFRRQYAAEHRLEALIDALPTATAFEDVDDALVTKASTTLRLQCAAVLRPPDDGGAFALRKSIGWDESRGDSVAAGDPLMAQLREQNGPVDVAGSDLMAIPVMFGRRIYAIAFYCPHGDGQPLGPDEIRLLHHLANSAAPVYEVIEDAAMRAEIDRLRTENQALRNAAPVSSYGQAAVARPTPFKH